MSDSTITEWYLNLYSVWVSHHMTCKRAAVDRVYNANLTRIGWTSLGNVKNAIIDCLARAVSYLSNPMAHEFTFGHIAHRRWLRGI